MRHEPSIRTETMLWAGISVLATAVLLAQVAARGAGNSPTPASLASARQVPASMAGVVSDATPMPSAEASGDASGSLLVEAVVQIESGGRPDCVGLHGERGLMQIRAATWQEVTQNLFGDAVPFERAFDPVINRQVGHAYLEYLGRHVDRHQDRWQSDRRSLILACYNAGPSRVLRSGFDLGQLPSSTRSYVQRATALHDHLLSSETPAVRVVARVVPPADASLLPLGS